MNYQSLTFNVGKNELFSFSEGQKKCYLLANNLGGFSSLTALGSCTRRDHGLLIGSKKAPNHRIHMVTNVVESITFKSDSSTEPTNLFSQEFVTQTNNHFAGHLLESFAFQYLPKWTYRVKGLEIVKEAVLVQDQNLLVLRYEIYAHHQEIATLHIDPLFRLTDKDDHPQSQNDFIFDKNHVLNKSTGYTCYYQTNGQITPYAPEMYKDLFFGYDSRDGRECIGQSVKGCTLSFPIESDHQTYYIAFSDTPLPEMSIDTISALFEQEIIRQKSLISQSNLEHPVAQSLVLAADKYIAQRHSTQGKTIMAGYPFFGDWGRDTMIAMLGCTITTKRFEDAKSILRTFKEYEKNGMMPNVFPEGSSGDPLYNTVDASLLFIDAVYQLYCADGDLNFVSEMYDTMVSIIENYRQGTDFHIRMDDDGLIAAGAHLEQLTWMDIRFGDILPTPRHGKPVEINAYWYNALCIMHTFATALEKDPKDYLSLAENKVKPSFLKLFWNEEASCLKDVISGTDADCQIRCNQVWALSMPFTMIDPEKAKKILGVIYSHLYTPFGLRSLSPRDKEFHPTYGGSHFNRDMAYHQGTTWGFPLGAYYLAVLRFLDSSHAIETVTRQLNYTATALYEGCLGQIAEIYDGANPIESQGCFAQAWSVGEILRVYGALEQK